MRNILLLMSFLSGIAFAQYNPGIQNLGKDFFAWRASEQPVTGDDVPRIERPKNWIPDFSTAAIKKYNQKYIEFKKRLAALSPQDWSRRDSVDYLLLRSAIERVNWELNVLKLPEKDPDFYVQQSIGSVFELLVVDSPMNDNRIKQIILRLNSIPGTIKNAEINLTQPVAAFADIALGELEGIDKKVSETQEALSKLASDSLRPQLKKAFANASSALVDYASWIKKKLPAMSDKYSVGRKAYLYFLKYIALTPYSPEEILSMGHLEFNRAVSFDVDETLRDKDVPQPKVFSNINEQIAQEKKDESDIRTFLAKKGIMSVPPWVQHYYNRKMPAYLGPLSDIGETDDFTSPSRLNENAVRYIPAPSPNLPFFLKASAEDPRPIIVHEGVPGHYFQLVRSWANSDAIRRHYIDSGANEGIAFYLEELMQQFGLFDNKPHTREIIYRFMRLRALRVDVDVNLALGNYTIKDAAKYLASTVPMDYASAIHEAGFFALTPGQGISYQIGKLQILKLISDGKLLLGDKFNLKDYHDYMLDNGNVPIALQRWEYLGLKDQIKKLWN